jgi:hypothetical protein
MAFAVGFVPEIALGAEELGIFAEASTGLPISGAIQGAVIGEVGNIANKAAGGVAETVAEKVLGKDTVDSLHEKWEKSKQLGSSFFDYMTGGIYGHNTNQQEFVDPRQGPIPTPNQQTPTPNQQTPTPTPQSSGAQGITCAKKEEARTKGKDLGSFISKTATEMLVGAAQNEKGSNVVSGIYDKVFGSNPLLSYLAPGLENFQAQMTLPTNEDYQKIAAVYNGKNLDYRNVLETVNADGTKDFSAKDELGITHTWFGAWNNHPVIQPIYGVFVGLNSPNNAKPVSLLDLFAMFHDIDYKQFGNFNQTADYKLISRVFNNLNRFNPQEKQMALLTVKYFSTVGAAARAYAGVKGDGTLDLSVDESIIPHLVPDTPEHPEDYLEMKYHFVDGMMEGIIRETSISSPIASPGQTNYSRDYLLSIIDNLEVSLE